MKPDTTIYTGLRQFDSQERRNTGTPAVVRVDGKPLSPARSQRVRNHSPDGFNWSYGGSGPAQLALAILLDFTGDRELAQAHYQHFKFEFVAGWGHPWQISGRQIREWMALQAETYGDA